MSSSSSIPPPADRRWMPLAAPHCPRCGSPNTKFCYYNNYSLSQPRHFCKTCRRYWTMGGSLRNVPLGGGCRKNRRPTPKPAPTCSTTALPSPTTHVRPDLHPHDGPAVATAPAIDLAALYAKFSDPCAPPPPPPAPPPQLEARSSAAAELEHSNSGGADLFGERRTNGGEYFLGQVMSQELQHCYYSVDGELEFSADPSGVFGGVPSPLEFIDGFPSSDLDLSVPDLVNEDSACKLALESTPAEGMAFHHHDFYSYW